MNHTPLVPTGATTDYLISSLVSLDPPLPVYLFHMVAGLRDKSAKGYPLKKVRTPLFCLRSFLSLRFFATRCYCYCGRLFWLAAVVQGILFVPRSLRVS